MPRPLIPLIMPGKYSGKAALGRRKPHVSATATAQKQRETEAITAKNSEQAQQIV
jgi:hypothetical protein